MSGRGRVQREHKMQQGLDYKKKGYGSVHHARNCMVVQKVKRHHGHHIHDWEMFLSILASGVTITTALLTVGITLLMV
jgi:hypothetical protein